MHRKTILIAPLEWGLGHSSRCVPLAIALQAHGHNVIFAAGDNHLKFLRQEVPSAKFLLFPGFNPTYSRHLPMWLVMILKSPVLVHHIIHEHFQLKEIVKRNNIDVVISDNRFGMWNKSIRSVYITHQLRIRFPRWTFFIEPFGVSIHRWFIKKYDYCLVPDINGDDNLSGELSHHVSTPSNIKYIGILSRFASICSGDKISYQLQDNQLYKHFSVPSKPFTLVIMSGPEPQRSVFCKGVTKALKGGEELVVLLGANPSAQDDKIVDGNLIYYPHLSRERMRELIIDSNRIITRSGYTTIMELVSLDKHALVIPTPGQTEQEYLAEYLSAKGWFSTIKQSEMNKKLLLKETIYTSFPIGLKSENNELLTFF